MTTKPWMTLAELRAEFPVGVTGNNHFQYVQRGQVRRRLGTVRGKTKMLRLWRYNTKDVRSILEKGNLV